MHDDQAKQHVTKWYREYAESIYRYIYIRVGDHQLAKDLTHDTFLKAYQQHDQFQGYSSPKTWIYSIARHVTIDFLRRKKALSLFSYIGLAEMLKKPVTTRV